MAARNREQIACQEGRGNVTRDEKIVTMDKGILTMDKGIVAMDKGIVPMDKGIVAKEEGIGARDEGIVTKDEGIVPRERAGGSVAGGGRSVPGGPPLLVELLRSQGDQSPELLLGGGEIGGHDVLHRREHLRGDVEGDLLFQHRIRRLRQPCREPAQLLADA
jgi:hypothetical protein